MLKILLAFLMFLEFSSANACTCDYKTVERVALQYKNIIKVKVVKSDLSDYFSDFFEKTKLLFSGDKDFQNKYDELKKIYTIKISEHLKGNYEGNQIYLGASNCSAIRIKFEDEFYIFFDEEPWVGICNSFFDQPDRQDEKSFSKSLKEYIKSPKPDIEPIKLKEWTLIDKSASHTAYANFNAITNHKNGNKIVWILYDFNDKYVPVNSRTGLSHKKKVEISCSKQMHRDHIEYYFSNKNASGTVVQVDNKYYDASRDEDSGSWYPINKGFDIYAVMKRIC